MGDATGVVSVDFGRDQVGGGVGSHTSTVRAGTFSGRIASQDAEELSQFLALLKAENVKSYGEIGAREGDTFYAVLKALGCRGVAMDLPGGAWGKESTRPKLERVIGALHADGFDASAIFGDSTTDATIRQFSGRGPYDAILIDGDHRLDGVTADWRNYRSMARIIAFHDIDGDGQQSKRGEVVEVPILWQSIKRAGLRTQEFITPNSHMGIGVVWPHA